MVLKYIYLIFVLFLISLQVKSQDFIRAPYQNFRLGAPVIADFNGDQKPDVLGINFAFSSDNSVVLQMNNSDTDTILFVENELNIAFDVIGQPVAIDIDSDGDVDAVVSRNMDLELFALVNDGAANFTLEPLNVSGVHSLKALDMDSDGDTDMVGVNIAEGSLSIFINEGNQIFTKIPITTGNSSNFFDMFFDVGDLDQDNDVDLVIGFESFFGDQILTYENDGSLNFTENVVISGTAGGTEGIEIHDLNSDGQNDIVTFEGSRCEVFLNQGDLTFEQEFLVTPGNSVRSMTIGDFNGDNKSDIILGTNGTGVFFYENQSNVPLTFEEQMISEIRPVFTLLNVDLDNDGDQDLLPFNGEFWWLENIIDQEVVNTTIVLNKSIKVFPNPFESVLQFENVVDHYDRLEVFDITGKLIFSSEVQTDQVSLSSLRSGVYFLSFKDLKGKSNSQTILIEKK